MGRSKRKRRKTSSNITIMCITAITALNLCGISYASWQDSLNINTKISTGIMKPIFDENSVVSCKLSESNEGEYLKVEIIDGKISITGRVMAGNRKTLAIGIVNDKTGTVPFVLDVIKENKSENNIARLVKERSRTDEVNVEINAKIKANIKEEQEQTEKQEPENYKFGYELIFEQWN